MSNEIQRQPQPNFGLGTRCVHGGDRRNQSRHVSSPISRSTAFEFPTVEEGAERAADIEADEFYGRWGSTNARELEAVVASLECAEDAVCAASGLGIIAMVLLAFLDHGDHFVSVDACYSETKILQESLAAQLGASVTFVKPGDADGFTRAIRPETRLVYVETPANPTLSLVDVAAVVAAAREISDAVVVVDSTFATPYNQQPLTLGADLVLHSATKYLGGHSDVVAGVCAGSGKLTHKVRERFSYHGPHLDPFAAWLLCRGLKTLALRMERHNHNAARLAATLELRPEVQRVLYPGLPSHPQHDLATRQMSGAGGMICFEVHGGRPAALALISSVQMIKLAVSLGGVDSLICHPASMTHNLLPQTVREAAGLTEGMLRLSTGVEDTDDIEADLMTALDCAKSAASRPAIAMS